MRTEEKMEKEQGKRDRGGKVNDPKKGRVERKAGWRRDVGCWER